MASTYKVIKSDLIADVRYQADIVGNTSRHSDVQLGKLADRAYSELHGEFPDYFALSYESKVSDWPAGAARVPGQLFLFRDDSNEFGTPFSFRQILRVAVQGRGGHSWVMLTPVRNIEKYDFSGARTGFPRNWYIENQAIEPDGDSQDVETVLRFVPPIDDDAVVRVDYLPFPSSFTSASATTEYDVRNIPGAYDWMLYYVCGRVAARDGRPDKVSMFSMLWEGVNRRMHKQYDRTVGRRRVDVWGRRVGQVWSG